MYVRQRCREALLIKGLFFHDVKQFVTAYGMSNRLKDISNELLNLRCLRYVMKRSFEGNLGSDQSLKSGSWAMDRSVTVHNESR